MGGVSRRGNLGWVWGAWPQGVGQSRAPLTSSPPCNHNILITLILTLTFVASWFGHASHVD